MKKIFYDGKIWKGFEAPEKQNYIRPSLFAIIDGKTYLDKKSYNQAYAEAKRNSLTILNPELFTSTPKYGYGIEPEGKDYDWPGEWEVKMSDGWQPTYNNPDNRNLDPMAEPEGIVLSLSKPVKPATEFTNSGHGFSEGGDVPNKPESPREGNTVKCYTCGKEYPKHPSYCTCGGARFRHIEVDELQSLRDQLAAKEEEIARYIAANSILCDSESEVKLANENNRLEIENRKLKEIINNHANSLLNND